MSKQYPRLRWAMPNDQLILREGVIFSFSVRRPHREISHAVESALEIYLDTVGRDKLGWIQEPTEGMDPDEYKGWCPGMVPLDEKLWASVREQLHRPVACTLELEQLPNEAGGYRFSYLGRTQEIMYRPGNVSQVFFWLPTEYLEDQGPARVKALAIQLARVLPFNSGYASLGFNAIALVDQAHQFIHEQSSRHPGMDLSFIDTSMCLGTKVRGAYWLNFYSPPLLDELGGLDGLEARLTLPGVSIEELSPHKVLVALEEWPDMGESQRQGGMEPYRALARILEPSLSDQEHAWTRLPRELVQRWRRRFLD